MKLLLRNALLCLICLTTLPTWAESSLNIGVLAFRPKAEALEQWKPLGNYLETELGRKVNLSTYTLTELEAAIQRNELDVVLTNPAHYILLQHRNGLSAPLVTQVTQRNQHELKAFGGVIFTRAESTEISSLSTLTGIKIAATKLESLGGYKMQAYELLANDLPEPSKDTLVLTGMPQDRVVEAVLAGDAEAGFVRTGLLESMMQEGKLDLKKIKVLNKYELPSFPFMVSTRLYPEWPVATLPKVNEHLSRQLTIALLSLKADHPAAIQAKIHGFTVPANYAGVNNLLRRLRAAPFDYVPQFMLIDLWVTYTNWIIIIALLALLLLGVSLRLTLQNKKVRKINDSLFISKQQLSNVLQGSELGYWDWYYQTGEHSVDDLWLSMLGLASSQIKGDVSDWDLLIHPDDKQLVMDVIQAHIKAKTPYITEFRMKHADGHWVWIQGAGAVVEYHYVTGEPVRLSGTHQDISLRKKSEQALLASQVLLQTAQKAAKLGSYVTNINECTWSNDKAFDSIFGIDEHFKRTFTSWEGIVHPDDRSQLTECIRASIKKKEQFLSMEYRVTRPSDGETVWVASWTYNEYTKDGLVTKQTGVIQDITERKRAEEKLALSARVLNEAHESIAITDANGLLIDINPAFSDITGYERSDVIGHNPKILSSGRQTPDFYEVMWSTINKRGYWKGEIWNRKKSGEVYASLMSISALYDLSGAVLNYISISTDITDSKNQQEKLNLMAHYDALTGLPNRVLFADRFKQSIAHSKRSQHQLAVCFLDLDSFKPVNDNYGHEVGDKLLVEVANRITGIIREEDTVSRQGGDEFALLLNDIESSSQCEQTLERIHHSLAKPYLIDNIQHVITASSGATIYPNDNGDIDTLLRHADQAMYQAKLAGKHRYHLFNPEHDQLTIQKHHQIEEVKNALENNEFQLYYQPKVNMVTGVVFGAEALIRWVHPEKGIIPPLDFLPLIEDTELELMVGDWVINTALSQLEEWNWQGIKLEVSVNISSNHLLSETFFANLEMAMAQHATVAPQCLQLEILESSALGDLNAISAVIETCKGALGVTVALDDFGTGYSSLTHLRSLPVDTIKIDQSFVRDMLDDPSDYTIIDGVIGLSDSFNRQLIAEGVETTNHGLMLLLMGCGEAQGYGIAKPMPAADLPQWIHDYRPNEEWLHIGNKRRTTKENKIKLFRLMTEHWKNKFIENIQSPPDNASHWPIMSSNICPCGSQIKRAIQDELFEAEGLEQLNQTHDALHNIANAIHQHYQTGDIEMAREGLPKLLLTFEQMNNAVGLLE